jgi:hypothetical protein
LGINLKFIRGGCFRLYCSSLEEHHFEDLSASGGFGSKPVSCELALEVNFTAQGIGGEGGMQFRLNIRRSKNFISFEGIDTRKFL